ncbi:MAG: hypothetical protein HIU83_17085 [Proteobacteria bacterium]|nr:hypothetical protein [Pseudomonadota bacterium]
MIRLEGLLSDLSAGTRFALTQQLTRYRKAKEALAAVVENIAAASLCRECGGQCCLNGKYRVNVFDALAHVTIQIPVTADFFQKPLCPYGAAAGCTMEPGMRPADCILFLCDGIDQKLSLQDRLILAEQEQDVRECIQEASSLMGESLGTPLLLWAEKNSNTSKLKVQRQI